MNHSVSPAVVDQGPGNPEVAIVGGVHGNEPSGVRAVRSLLDKSPAFDRGVRFILANPPAYLANERYFDEDLNRAFPGDEGAPERERRLAAQLSELTEGLPTLALHATHSHPEPIAVVALTDPIARLAASLPVSSVVDETRVTDGSFTDHGSVVTLEAGCQYTDEAVETATEQARAFLVAVGALDGTLPDANPTFYREDEPVEKPANASYELLVDNFERVDAGTTYATADGEEFVADRPFTPILMSECGYDDIFGFKGTRLGATLDAARQANTVESH